MGKFKELITDDSNIVLEPAYVWGAISFLVGLGLQIYSVIHGSTFDIQAYGIGVGALIAGTGIGKKLGNSPGSGVS